MRSDTDSSTAQPANGCGPALNERVISTRHLQALFALPPAAIGAEQSLVKRHCLYKRGWS